MKRLLALILILVLVSCGSWVYATQMPEEVVGTGTDDGHEDRIFGNCYATEDWVCMSFPYDCERGFFRFTSIPIPQGATINACTMYVDILSTLYDSPWVDIFCEDTASATTLSGELWCIKTRTKTTAYATWNELNIGAGVKPTPELKTVLQEIVDRSDWNANNDLAFIFISGSDKQFYVDSYEEGHPAKLHVWYTVEEAEADMRIKDDWRFTTHFMRDWRFQNVGEWGITPKFANGEILKRLEDGKVAHVVGRQ